MSGIDLRSDTVTKPSTAMRRAMAEAEVGDDVLDGDPTTRRLEQRVAELLGKGDALFFPSGTQANMTGIAMCTTPGTELVLEADAHLVHYEVAGVALLAGVQIRPVATPDGLLSAELVRGALRPPSPHVPRVSAIALENTHNAAGGRVLPLDRLTAITALAAERHLPVHLDGARLWNAAAALNQKLSTLTAGVATVMVSLSKGLGCPVGSCLAFDAGRRAEAWEIRKRLGGGMRQSGILAAAGLHALDVNLSRLAEDHANAKAFAGIVAENQALRPVPPDSNIVMVDLVREQDAADRAVAALESAGVLCSDFGPRRLRFITHLDVSRADVERAAGIVARVLA
ncbi:MAG TPA: GntG family PLP-dependent aldolase [Gemmatimonadales bacterium]|nr:GntG family PLP-dependent aldolase [Gemmatimonadales bacterium]